MARYLLDTNVLIDHLRGDPSANQLLRDVESGRLRATISVITECELLSYPRLTAGEERQIRALLGVLPKVAVTSHVAQLAAQLRRRYPITIADALIAATALRSHAILLTRNTKDFHAIHGLHLASPPLPPHR